MADRKITDERAVNLIHDMFVNWPEDGDWSDTVDTLADILRLTGREVP